MVDYPDIFDPPKMKVFEDILAMIAPYHTLSINYSLGDGMFDLKADRFEIRFARAYSLTESVTVTVDFTKKETTIENGSLHMPVHTGVSDGIFIGCLAAHLYEYWFGGKHGPAVED